MLFENQRQNYPLWSGYDIALGGPSSSCRGSLGGFWEQSLSEVENVFSEFRKNRQIGTTSSTFCYRTADASPAPRKATV